MEISWYNVKKFCKSGENVTFGEKRIGQTTSHLEKGSYDSKHENVEIGHPSIHLSEIVYMKRQFVDCLTNFSSRQANLCFIFTL